MPFHHQSQKMNNYDGLSASEYLAREFSVDKKPNDCTCGYPRTKVRNGIGHPNGCPTWLRLAPAFYECKGQKFLGVDDQGCIMVSMLESKQNIVVGDRVSVNTSDGDDCVIESGTVTYVGEDGFVEVIGDDSVSGMWPDRFVKSLRSTNNTKIYESVVEKISNGTVTTADFNSLIESTDKSAREKVLRHARVTNPEPTDSVSNPFKKIVPKRKGRNDPPNQGRGKRYASGTFAKKKQNKEQSRRNKAKHQASVSESVAKAIAKLGSSNPITEEAIAKLDTDFLGILRCVSSSLLIDVKTQQILESKGLKFNDDHLMNTIKHIDVVLSDCGIDPNKLQPFKFTICTNHAETTRRS